ncbi:hypothetical protein N2152v2_004270 [Parachlorella kessleri]
MRPAWLAAPVLLRAPLGGHLKSFCSAQADLDLLSWAPKYQSFESKTRWVAFSDLHVSTRTKGVCLEVLAAVKEEAEARNAGVLFLGDFWHMRGSLPVEPLNDVIRQLAGWRVPMLCLVGNHDQVSLGGLIHSLTPLAAASPYIHVFDRPCLYRGALWLPYRRDHAELEAAVAAGTAGGAAGAAGQGDLKAIFAHVDVVGAMMNDAFQAHDGVPPSLFPPGLHVYTGHYHKPHTVEGTSIRYLGSPYQVSRSEAGQAKHLLVLDQDWRVCEEIPLDIGPRHFEARAGEGLSQVTGSLRRGDRLRLTMGAEEGKSHKKLLKKLQEEGVEVEVVAPAAAHAAPRLGAGAEDLGPLALLARYASMTRMGDRATLLAAELLKGLEASSGHALGLPSTHLSFESLELEGYFSFKDRVAYRLGSRGLVVVTGRVEGPLEAGMESNGAGKTALMMAPLWALTGSVDSRSESNVGRGLTNADIINDDAKAARVRLEGAVNGVPFVVERVAVRRGKGARLDFWLDGEHRTQLEMKLTQALIDEELATPLLGRTVFYGQSDVTGLLESNDRAFKEELGKLVDLTVWAQAKEESRQQLATRRAQLSSCETQLSVHSSYLHRDEKALHQAETLSGHWESQKDSRAGVLLRDLRSASQQLRQAQTQLASAAGQLRSWLAAAEAASTEVAAELAEQEAQQSVGGAAGGSFVGAGPLTTKDFLVERDLAAAPNAGLSDEKNEDEEPALVLAQHAAQQAQRAAQQAQQAVQEAQSDLGVAQYRVQERRKAIQEYEALALELQPTGSSKRSRARASINGGHRHSDGEHAAGAVCDRCLQPINPSLFIQNVERMQAELENAEQAEQGASARLSHAMAAAQQAQQAAQEAAQQAQRLASQAAAAEAAVAAEAQRRRVEELQEAQRRVLASQQVERRLLRLRQELGDLNSLRQQGAELAQQAEQALQGLAHAAAQLAQLDPVPAADSNPAVRLEQGERPGLEALWLGGASDVAAVPAGIALTAQVERPWHPSSDLHSTLPATLEQQEEQQQQRSKAVAAAAEFDGLAAAVRQILGAGQRLVSEAGRLVTQWEYMQQQQNPHAASLERLTASVAEAQARLAELEGSKDQLEQDVLDYRQVDEAFRPTGIVNFVLEGVLGDLQAATARHLAAITAGIALELLPCKPSKKDEEAAIEQVQKVIQVRHAATGELRQRSVKQLSSGERRRVALALALGFSELAAQRGQLRSNLLVLDEVMQHLDEEGCLRVAGLLKQLPYSSVLVVAQAHSFLTQALDAMDIIVKKDGVSMLEIG